MGPDVIICGAGEGGLFTAAILAKKGLEPLVLEKKSIIGGRAACMEYKPGYLVDYGVHSIRYGKKGIIPTIFREDLGIELSLLDYSPGKLFRKGAWVEVPTGVKGFMKTTLLSNEEREKFIPIFMELVKLNFEDYLDVSIQDYFKDKISSENSWSLIRLLAAGLMVTPEIERASLGEFLDGIKQVVLSGKGATYPEGGWKKIFDQLVDIISQKGEIRTKTSVEKVLISNKQVEGVLLNDGSRISSDMVVVAIPAQQIFSVLPESEFPPKFSDLCKDLTPSSGIAIDYGLKEKISDDNGLIVVDDPMTLACFTSNIDPSTAPDNEQLFTILQPLSKATVENPQASNKVVEGMKKLVIQMYPGIEKKVKWERVLRLPIIDGAVNYIGQTRDKRPNVKSDVISGLYFSGDTYNGPGLGGDIAPSSARLCANAILDYLNK